MTQYLRLLLAIGLILGGTTASKAAELTFIRGFHYPGPSGLAYDDRYCGLWVASESKKVTLITPWGDEIMSFDATLSRVDAIAIDGDDLVLSDGNGLYQRVDRGGAPKSDPFRLAGILMDTDGLYIDSDTHEYWVADDSIAQLVRVTADGVIAQQVDGASQSAPLMEPQGITRDPNSGNLLVVDDADASDSLFEFSPEGQLMDVIPLNIGGYDAEGITVQPETQTVFVAYDDGNAIAAFHYVPTGGLLHLADTEQFAGCVISAVQVGIPKG